MTRIDAEPPIISARSDLTMASHNRRALAFACFVAVSIAWASPSAQTPGAQSGSQTAAAAAPVTLKGKLERIKVHGKSLTGNLMGETDSPEVSIYLPPGYATDRARRYPVVYLLHGYTSTDLTYFGPTGR